MIRVGVLAGDTVMATSLAVTVDVINAANRIARQLGGQPGFHIDYCGLPTSGPPVRVDCLVVPGLGVVSEPELDHALARDDSKRMIDIIARAASAGSVVASSCASSFLLARAGVLDGRRATTSWFLAPLFARRHPAIRLDQAAVVVEDGPIITGGAAMAQLDVMIRLVARLVGPDIARLCSRYLLIDQRQSQSGYVALQMLTASDARLAKAELWIRDNLSRGDISINDIAATAGLHPRTFARRLWAMTGLSPSRFLQRARLEEATELLQHTTLSVDEIAARVGYADASSLRKILRKEIGQSANAIRASAVHAAFAG